MKYKLVDEYTITCCTFLKRSVSQIYMDLSYPPDSFAIDKIVKTKKDAKVEVAI